MKYITLTAAVAASMMVASTAWASSALEVFNATGYRIYAAGLSNLAKIGTSQSPGYACGAVNPSDPRQRTNNAPKYIQDIMYFGDGSEGGIFAGNCKAYCPATYMSQYSKTSPQVKFPSTPVNGLLEKYSYDANMPDFKTQKPGSKNATVHFFLEKNVDEQPQPLGTLDLSECSDSLHKVIFSYGEDKKLIADSDCGFFAGDLSGIKGGIDLGYGPTKMKFTNNSKLNVNIYEVSANELIDNKVVPDLKSLYGTSRQPGASDSSMHYYRASFGSYNGPNLDKLLAIKKPLNLVDGVAIPSKGFWVVKQVGGPEHILGIVNTTYDGQWTLSAYEGSAKEVTFNVGGQGQIQVAPSEPPAGKAVPTPVWSFITAAPVRPDKPNLTCQQVENILDGKAKNDKVVVTDGDGKKISFKAWQFKGCQRDDRLTAKADDNSEVFTIKACVANSGGTTGGNTCRRAAKGVETKTYTIKVKNKQ